jgi:hypothetical protein
VLSTPPAFVLSQNQTLQTKTTQPKSQVHRKSEKSDIQQPVKTGKNKNHPHRQEDEESPTRMAKQQTKTTKHTIEFSNNTPGLTAHELRDESR